MATLESRSYTVSSAPRHFHPCEVCREPTPCSKDCIEDEYQEVVWCSQHKPKRKPRKDIFLNLRKTYAKTS